MDQSLRIALWNANGMSQHQQELKTFITNNNIDIILISETHFTSRNFMKIPRYDIYDTKHPSGRAHGGTAIIIKRTIKHHELIKYEKDFLQATSVVVEDWCGPLTLSAVYCHQNTQLNRTSLRSILARLVQDSSPAETITLNIITGDRDS